MEYSGGKTANFRVDVDMLQNAEQGMDNVGKKMWQINEELRDIKNDLKLYRILDRFAVGALQADLLVDRQKCILMGERAASIARKYRNADDRCANKPGSIFTYIEDFLDSGIAGSAVSILPIVPIVHPHSPGQNIIDFFTVGGEVKTKYGQVEGKLEDIYDKDSEGGGILGDIGRKVDNFNDAHKKDLYEHKSIDGKNIKDIEGGEKQFDELTKGKFDGIDFKVWERGTEVKDSIWQTGEQVAGDKEGTYASGNLRVLNLDREASVYAGFLSAGAAAGISVSMLSAEGEARFGSDMLGIYGKGQVDVLKGELSADASLGLFDKDGKINPNAHVGASAEALLGEISGSAGVNVLGAEVGVGGSLNVGIGAHADIGIKDWKITADIGASLGVGASVKIDIDLSGVGEHIDETVELVKGAAESVGNFVGDVAEGAGDFLEDVGGGIADFFGW